MPLIYVGAAATAWAVKGGLVLGGIYLAPKVAKSTLQFKEKLDERKAKKQKERKEELKSAIREVLAEQGEAQCSNI